MRGRRRSFPWRTPRGGAGAAVIFIGTLILIAVLWGARGGQGPRFSGSPPWSPGVPPSAGPATTAPAFEAVRVARVDDGDTIRLAGGREVRYLGMDTPERGEPLAAEAREENRRLVEGREVEIRRGGPEPHDRYGRLLALVYAGDGAGSERVFVNAAILRAGLGWVYLTGPEAVDPAPWRACSRPRAMRSREGRASGSASWKGPRARGTSSRPASASTAEAARSSAESGLPP